MQEYQRALEEGARRSRVACSAPSPSAPAFRRKLLRDYVWPRHKWLIIGALLFLLIDILVLSGIGSVGGHL